MEIGDSRWLSQLDAHISDFEHIRATFVSQEDHQLALDDLRVKLSLEHSKTVKQLTTANEKLKDQFISERETYVAKMKSLEGAVESLKTQNEMMTTQRKTVEDSLRGTIHRLKAELAEIQTEQAAALRSDGTDAPSAARATALEEDVRALRLRETSMTEELAATHRSSVQDRRALGEALEEAARLRGELDRTRAQVVAAEGTIAEQRTKIGRYKEEARAKHREDVDRCNKAMKVARQYREDYEKLGREIVALKHELNVLR
ncbi:Chromosome partition protein Smc [Carpediemonas membranifera]|uniref:Chromosome partition protein Smc n=1 Tax=Carpediemonas membranifera TaxID=201153 RepID=A0A8J6DXG8_9EUKA|nr:Chromosome partition protein Smc [Carpediemonas membranifera]|eukprot:KAG9390114.1 Chromosome partition protein Smc [Carpediemonas membranifera]